MKIRLLPPNRSLLAKIEALAGLGDTLPCIRDMALRFRVPQVRIRHLIARLKAHGEWPYAVARSPGAREKPPGEGELVGRLAAIREARERAAIEGRAFRLDDVLGG